MVWEFRAPKVVAGVGSISEIGRIGSSLGDNALLVLGSGGSLQRAGIVNKVVDLLNQAGVRVHIYQGVVPEPGLSIVELGLAQCVSNGCNLVIGLGGGSVIDTAKAIAALSGSDTSLVDAFHMGKALDKDGLPFIAVPTTAGTGAEATFNSVLTDEESGLKQSIRGQALLPTIALVDPELTLSLPPSLTAQTGMDALTQAIESYVSKGASPITDSLALEAAALVGRNLKEAFYNGKSIEHRTAIAHGSLLAGIALANARLGGVHGMAHAIGSRCSIAHGTVCAVLLPYIVRFNWEYSKDKYVKIQEMLDIDDLPQYIEGLNSSFSIPKKLGSLGLRRELFETIAIESLPSGSLKANPRQITKDDIYDILDQNL